MVFFFCRYYFDELIPLLPKKLGLCTTRTCGGAPFDVPWDESNFPLVVCTLSQVLCSTARERTSSLRLLDVARRMDVAGIEGEIVILSINCPRLNLSQSYAHIHQSRKSGCGAVVDFCSRLWQLALHSGTGKVKRTSSNLDINQQDVYGFTALHHAFFNKDILTFATLLVNHADPFWTRDIFGRSVADLVAIKKDAEIHYAGQLSDEPFTATTSHWELLHLPMCKLVFGSTSARCWTNASSFGTFHVQASGNTHQEITANAEAVMHALPSDGHEEVGWVAPWPNMTVDWGPLRVPPPNSNGVRVLDARNATIADVIRSIARAEPIIIRNAMVGWQNDMDLVSNVCSRFFCSRHVHEFIIRSCVLLHVRLRAPQF